MAGVQYTVRFYPIVTNDAILSKRLFRDIGSNFPYAMLHDTTMLDNVVTDPYLEMEINRSGQFTFTVSQKHPLYSYIRSVLMWEVAVFQQEQFIWGGRPIQKSCDIYGNITIVCEGIASFLSDVYVAPFSMSGILPSSFLRNFMTLYNHECEAVTESEFEQSVCRHHIIQPFDVNGFDKDGNGTERTIKRYTDKTLPVMDVLQTRLIDYFGGYMYISMTNSSSHLWNLNWIHTDSTNISQQCTQVAEIGVNLEELSYEEDWTDFSTALVPVDENGNCIVSPLAEDITYGTAPEGTIPAWEDWYHSGVKAGSVMFYNLYLRKKYGLIAKEYTNFTGDEYQEQIVGTMLKEALRLRAPKRTIEAKAIDLSMISGGLQKRFALGKFVRVYSKMHSIDEWMLVRKMDIRLDNPAENTITLTTDTEGS